MSDPFHFPGGLPPDLAAFGEFNPRIIASNSSSTSAAPNVMNNTSNISSSRLSQERIAPSANPNARSHIASSSSSLAYPPGNMDSDRGSGVEEGATSVGLRSRPVQLPHCSRAFEKFLRGGSGNTFWSSQLRNGGFFVPSYLRGSTYVQKLEEANKEKQARKDSQLQLQQQQQLQQLQLQLQQHTSSAGSQNSVPRQNAWKPKALAHYGMTYEIIEQMPPSRDDGIIAPLPTRWNEDDKSGGLDIMAAGQEVKYTAHRTGNEREYETCSVRADHPMPIQAGIYYFEVMILSKKRDDTTICIGFQKKHVSLSRPPGWEDGSWAYHGDDGNLFIGEKGGDSFADPFTTGDTIGCGVNFRLGLGFFTKNGAFLGNVIKNIDTQGRYFPVVGLKRLGDHVRANFGQTPFAFDIDRMVADEHQTLHESIAQTSVEKLTSPPTTETSLIQQLVLQHLQHDGYVDTARAFAQEIQTEKQALSFDPDHPVDMINIVDDEDANSRQRIRRAILEGDIDRAIKYTNLYYPHVLECSPAVNFRLRCRKFIELVRRSAEANSSFTSSSSNHATKQTMGDHFPEDTEIPNEMDLDENGFADVMDMEDFEDEKSNNKNTTALDQMGLLTTALDFGRQMQEEYKNDESKEVHAELKKIYALLAYNNPFEEKEMASLLHKNGRVTVAEELNAAILSQLGRSSRSALENLYGQTSVMLDYMREEGGAGCFISVQSVIKEAPSPQPL